MVEDEKYKIGLYVRNEINRQTAGSLIGSSTNDVEKDETKKVINETKSDSTALIPRGENTTEKVSHDSKDSKSTKNVSCDQGSTPSQVRVIKRVSPIQSESVSSEQFSKNDLERSASASRLPKTKISSTQGKSRPTAVQASVIDAVSKRNSIKLVVPDGEDATSSLPPLSNVLTNRPGRGMLLCTAHISPHPKTKAVHLSAIPCMLLYCSTQRLWLSQHGQLHRLYLLECATPKPYKLLKRARQLVHHQSPSNGQGLQPQDLSLSHPFFGKSRQGLARKGWLWLSFVF